MKRIILVLSVILGLSITLVGCDCSNRKNVDYLNYVSELRYEVYEGKSQDYTIKASYGFRETPYVNDGKVDKTIYYLTFEMLNVSNLDATYFLNFTHDGRTYDKQFNLNHHKNSLLCEIELENFSVKSFTVNVGTINQKQAIVMQSVVPEKALDYKGAINSLIKSQPSLLENYKNENGEFCAEIYARILVKDSKAYWYIGIASGEGSLKALLIDGINGEILAVREVF